jgi:hypothetical protein
MRLVSIEIAQWSLAGVVIFSQKQTLLAMIEGQNYALAGFFAIFF